MRLKLPPVKAPELSVPGLSRRTAVRSEELLPLQAAATAASVLKKLTGKHLGPSWKTLRKMCRKRTFKEYRKGELRAVLSVRGPLEVALNTPVPEDVVRRVYQVLVLAETLPARRCLFALDAPLVQKPGKLRVRGSGDRPLSAALVYVSGATKEKLEKGLLIIDGEERQDVPRYGMSMEYRPIKREALYARVLDSSRLVMVYAVNLER